MSSQYKVKYDKQAFEKQLSRLRIIHQQSYLMKIIDSLHNFINISDELGVKTSLDIKYEEAIKTNKLL
jgi:hypothetical protein